MRSKNSLKSADLVLIRESQSNQKDAMLCMRSGFASFDQMVLVNNWRQRITDLMSRVNEVDARSLNLTAINPTGRTIT